MQLVKFVVPAFDLSVTKMLLFLTFILTVFLIFPDYCFAWGVGIHIADGLFVLNNLASIKPIIASSIVAYPYDYLYGCISADIFIGKGYKRRDNHCHNWSVALNMLDRADTTSEKAFMYGYLSHLAADVIAHNYFIPNQLYITPTSKRMGHVYWEIRSDAFMEPEMWKIAMRVIEKHNKKNDRFMKKAIKKTPVPFFAKKRAYYRSIKMHNLKLWRTTLTTVSNYSKWEIHRDYIMSQNFLSLNLVMDFLKNPDKAVSMKYDPVGTDNTIMAKKMRRFDKKKLGQKPQEKIFLIPCDIQELAAVDPKEVRGLDIHQILAQLHVEKGVL